MSQLTDILPCQFTQESGETKRLAFPLDAGTVRGLAAQPEAPEQLLRAVLAKVEFLLTGGEPAEQPMWELAGDVPTACSRWSLDLQAGALEVGFGVPLTDEAVRILAGCVTRVLARVAVDGAGAVENADLLDAAERKLVLDDLNDTQIDYPLDACLHEHIEEQVKRTPHAIAVVAGDFELDYASLNERANKLARHLRSLGVGRDQRVAICVERGWEMVVGLLGILKAGGAYVPIDPHFPPERLTHMLSDSAPLALLTQGALKPLLAGLDVRCPVLDLSAAEPEWGNQSGENLPTSETGADPLSLAYMIYTSGSTGLPKGSMNEHRGIVNHLLWMQGQYRLDGRDTVLQKTPFSFDVSVWELFLPLMTGARLVMARPEGHKDPGYLVSLIRSQRVTNVHFVPSMLHAFLEHPEVSSCVGVVKRVLCSGEALPGALANRFLKLLPGVELHNLYGPTEAAVHVTSYVCKPDREYASVPIGRPIANTRMYVLDESKQPLPRGVVGELYIGGVQVGRGYLNRDELTAERFLPDPFSGDADARMYRTGDLARWLPDGKIDYLGRNDFQVKIRGFRIELGEIEARLEAKPGVARCVAMAREGATGDKQLVAYVVPEQGTDLDIAALRNALRAELPEYMVPQHFVSLPELPLLPNGKTDRKRLPAPSSQRPETGTPFVEPRDEDERQIATVFARILGLDAVGALDSFFDIGGNSLLAFRALDELRQIRGQSIGVAAIFSHPTPAGLARALSAEHRPSSREGSSGAPLAAGEPIAIIGMACRLPGSNTVEQFWDNLLQGKDLVTRFRVEQLDPSLPASLVKDPDYVPARGIIEGATEFDAAFFGVSPREAEILDPQQRIFLELAWECLERAGYPADNVQVPVGVFAGAGVPSYWLRNVSVHPEVIEQAGELPIQFANDKDYIATRVAYKLNLHGPAVNVNTACSTSLVAISQAVDSLRLGRCEMALAGAASLTFPTRSGYLYQEGGMLSRDGSTRTFDSCANGTVFSDGAGIVLLKPLSRALEDGDHVHAVLRGIAINNDGGGKASFTAPSFEGQAAVVAAAHRDAGVGARDISYVEAHGTATPLGDPVEIEGLTAAFRQSTSESGFCRIGSVKSNIGHAVTAAGVAGLIKVVLALENEVLPASIHYDKANSKIDFASSPFVVNGAASAWERTALPRRAGLSSFGVGGTNSHAVIEEAPPQESFDPGSGAQLLMLSARTPSALEEMAENLATHLDRNPDGSLADVAFTLQYGRSRFVHRLAVVAKDPGEAVEVLRARSHPRRASRVLGSRIPSVAMVFPGQGAQYAGMGRELYATHVPFREAFDECARAFDGKLDFDLRQVMFGDDAAQMQQTSVTQPATFCLEYALARMWQSDGVEPAAFIGHSIGEFAAAVLAGVMDLADAARLVALRGALMQALPAGSMMQVRLPVDQVEPLLSDGLSLAAHNGPSACVVSGPTPLIEALQEKLAREEKPAKRLFTSHAFHSSMMDPVVEPFAKAASEVAFRAPRKPIYSTLTGQLLRDSEAVDPRYWARHLREPVRFSSAVQQAVELGELVFLEVGPRGSLSTLVRQHKSRAGNAAVAIASLSDSADTERASVLLAQGQLWTFGVEPAHATCFPRVGRRRVQLPTYPFERKVYELESVRLTPVHSPQVSQEDPVRTMTPKEVNSRVGQLTGRLRALFEDVSGMDLGAAGPEAGFVEMGLDSLTLTQAALQIKRTFKTSITFRQLMEQYPSLDALARHLDSVLPPDPVVSVQAAPAVAAAVPVPAQPSVFPAPARISAPVAFSGVSGSLVEQIIAQQMHIMNEQLELLRGGVATAPVAAPAASGVPAAPPAASAAASGDAQAEGPMRYDVKKAFGAIARIHTQPSQVTAQQRAQLEAFATRYAAKTRKSKEYTAAHRKHLADPRVVNGFRPMTKELTYQIVVERSKGSRLWDIDGNEYIDVLNGFGMNLFGWQPDFLQEAVRRQLDAGYEIGPMHPLAGEVANLVCELTGCDRAGLCNTGSEAVMAAIRIARTVTGRSTIVTFTGDYHGTFDEVLVRAGRNAKGIPAAPGIMPGVFGDIRVLDYGTPESLEFIRANADDLAAVLVEPVQSRRPDFQPREFLREVRSITEKSGTCLIFDEVITGFRSHLRGAQGLFDIRADLATYGKVIGGGFPVGVVAGKREYMDALDGGSWQYGDDSVPTVGVTYFAGTFVRHPLAMAAAKASLLKFKEAGNSLQERLTALTTQLAAELNAYFRSVKAPLEIRHFSSLWRVTWLEDHPLQDLLFAMLRYRGIHILDNFPSFMTTAHSEADIAEIKRAFRESVAEMQAAGFLPS